MSTRNTPALASESPSASAPTGNITPEKPSKPDYKLCARLMIQEDKPFIDAAVEAGYSLNTAQGGPADLARRTPGFQQALEEETRRIPSSTEIQALAVRTLIQDLKRGESRGLERTVETLGKMKVYDWFVRNSETNLGIFMAFTEPAQSQANEKTIDIYQE